MCHGLGMTEILGRQAELAAISAFLTDRGGEARALVLEGEPGIGKTTLWRWAVANAESEGVIVLRAQPAELEQDLAFATLGDLLAEALDEIEALPEPQRRALRIALLLEESDGRLLDERAVGTALATLLRELAGDGLALLAIDDAQWADPSSWACVRFALRRLDVRVKALLTCRVGFTLDPQAAKLSVQPLTDEAVRELVAQTADGVFSGDEVVESPTSPPGICSMRSRSCVSPRHAGARMERSRTR